MEKKVYQLETNLLTNKTGEQTDLAQGALVASGVATQKELFRYVNKIDRMCEIIEESVHSIEGDRDLAGCIFDWLWRSKPYRYKSQGPYKLTDAIDAQLGRARNVGNCLGLTIIYNVLARKFGLSVRAGHFESAFGAGPHVFTMLDADGSTIDIENIFPNGFDYQGHRNALGRDEWTDREIIADIYHSLGNELLESGKKRPAIESYEKAIALNPEYTKALLNKGIALTELGRDDEATRWFRTMNP